MLGCSLREDRNSEGDILTGWDGGITEGFLESSWDLTGLPWLSRETWKLCGQRHSASSDGPFLMAPQLRAYTQQMASFGLHSSSLLLS